MRKSENTRDKVCKTILDILNHCDILGGQTVKQRYAIIQTTTDQCLCYHDWDVIWDKVSDMMQISKVNKTGFSDRIYMIHETKFRVKQYTQITNNIWGEAVSKKFKGKEYFSHLYLFIEPKTMNRPNRPWTTTSVFHSGYTSGHFPLSVQLYRPTGMCSKIMYVTPYLRSNCLLYQFWQETKVSYTSCPILQSSSLLQAIQWRT